MKKILSISLLVVYFISTTEFHEFLKLPVLLEHFIEHQTRNEELSFLEFLAIHYSSDNTRHADQGRDMQLPFKSHEGHMILNVVSFPIDSYPVDMERPVIANEEIFVRYHQDLIPESYLSDIWEPPKPC